MGSDEGRESEDACKLMKKIFMIFIVLGYLNPVHAADNRNYAHESVDTKFMMVSAKVLSQRTLIDRTEPTRYSVKNLFDGNKASAWVTKYNTEDVEMLSSDNGLLKIIFQEPVYVKSLTISNGYQKTSDLYRANQRVKDLSIEKILPGGRTYPLDNTVQLKDSMEEQEISLTAGWTQSINLFKTKEIVINVLDIYPGMKSDDLCISEMRINLMDHSGYVPGLTWEKLKKLIDENSAKRDSTWDWVELNKNGYKLFNDLLYYVLNGNREAYMYFNNYKSEGVGISEEMKSYRPAVNALIKDSKNN